MRAQIEVTATDIRRGQRESAESCPIALAIIRKLAPSDLFVDDEEVTLTVGDKWARVDLPTRATKFIKAFDGKGRKAVRPIAFRLEISFRD